MNATVAQVAAIDEVDIGEAVAVEIADTDAGTSLFQDRRNSIARFGMNPVNARRLRDVGELDGWKRPVFGNAREVQAR